MKKNVYTLLAGCAALVMACSKPMATNPEQISLVKKWATEPVLNVPESVLFDKARNVLYVSNINGAHDGKDGNGFISKLSTGGKIEELEWAKGLDAPKGMGLVKDLLYVADITKVVVIDTKTGQKVKEIEPAGAKFLNDITVDTQCNVYVSDSAGNKVYRLTNDVA
ncbi:MAG: ATP-binding protein, partial [Pyrinomonadaceae bacterium]|nr:ATP-binding protein [Pyrinomonadaceae bacterium]